MAAADTLVLVHGYLGYGEANWGLELPDRLAYFRGVEAALQAAGHRVRCPSLPPQGSVAERAGVLAQHLADPQACPGERLHLVAHSMGGLDALLALHRHPEATARVRSVVAIGTPFRGSPVADALLAGPAQLSGPLEALHKLALLPLGPALKDLSTAGASQLTLSAPLGLNVRWATIAGADARQQTDATLFKAISQLPLFKDQANDGLVPHSATRLQGAEEWPAWPADHAQLVGWTLWFSALPPRLGPALTVSPGHLSRYQALAQRLVG